jgi:hypothetical protein
VGATWKQRASPPQSAKKEVEIDKAIKEMLLNKIIEPSSAVYYSHPVIVRRTLNSFRFCIDYRRLNECLNYRRLNYRRVGLSHSFEVCPNASTTPNRRFLVRWTSPRGSPNCFTSVYQFTRLPFGPKRAPSYFRADGHHSAFRSHIHHLRDVFRRRLLTAMR